MKKNLPISVVIGLSIVLVSGCGPKRPLQEIVDAKIAIEKAKEAGAEEYAPKRLEKAQDYLIRALEMKRKKESRGLAREAEVDARIAESMTMKIKEEKRRKAAAALEVQRRLQQEAEKAIGRAQEAIDKAKKENREVEVAREKLDKAREAFQKESFEEAKNIAQEVKKLALNAEAKLPEYHKVKKGETLEVIAKKIYGNPKKWVLIYRANREKIKNANIIYPGQILRIPKDEK